MLSAQVRVRLEFRRWEQEGVWFVTIWTDPDITGVYVVPDAKGSFAVQSDTTGLTRVLTATSVS